MKPTQDISKDPDMIELERMIEAGELDGDRARDYAIEKSQHSRAIATKMQHKGRTKGREKSEKKQAPPFCVKK